jgi:hypothetical protein
MSPAVSKCRDGRYPRTSSPSPATHRESKWRTLHQNEGSKSHFDAKPCKGYGVYFFTEAAPSTPVGEAWNMPRFVPSGLAAAGAPLAATAPSRAEPHNEPRRQGEPLSPPSLLPLQPASGVRATAWRSDRDSLAFAGVTGAPSVAAGPSMRWFDASVDAPAHQHDPRLRHRRTSVPGRHLPRTLMRGQLPAGNVFDQRVRCVDAEKFW